MSMGRMMASKPGAAKRMGLRPHESRIDVVYDSLGERNILRFGAGVDKNNFKLHLGSLLLDLGNGDMIHIGNFDRNNVFNSSSIDSFEFAVLIGREKHEAANDARYGERRVA